MSSIWIPIVSAVSAALVTILVNQLVEYRKRVAPRVEYLVTRAVPIKIDGKYIGSYRVTVRNPSRGKVEQITILLQARAARLRIEEISTSPGLDGTQFNNEGSDGSIKLFVPYLKREESVKIIAVAESTVYVPETLDVSISSPNDVEVKSGGATAGESFFSRLPFLMAVISVIALLVIFVRSVYQTFNPYSPPPEVFRPNARDHIISSASTAGLPQFAELFASVPDPKYYEEGDLAYSLAAAPGNKSEINKYRMLLSLSLGSEPNMAPESQSSLFYCLGKLDLLEFDDAHALSDFKNAIAKSRETVEARAKLDVNTHTYLIEKGIL